MDGSLQWQAPRGRRRAPDGKAKHIHYALSNGKLLVAAAGAGFSVIVTVDKNLRYQRDLPSLPVAVLELDVIRSRLADLSQLAPFIPAALERIASYKYVCVRSDGALECLAPVPVQSPSESSDGFRRTAPRST